MNIMKKMGVLFSTLLSLQIYSGVILLDSLVHSPHDEGVVRTAIREYLSKHANLVFYYSRENSKSFINAKKEIDNLFAQYPDVMFVVVDLKKYTCLRGASATFFRLYRNSIFLQEVASSSVRAIKTSLDKHYPRPNK